MRIATRHQYPGVGIFAVDAANGGANILVGRRGHRAGIEDDHFGIGGTAGALHAVREQLALDGRAVGLRRAAAEVLHVIAGHKKIILGTNGTLSGVQIRNGNRTQRCCIGNTDSGPHNSFWSLP